MVYYHTNHVQHGAVVKTLGKIRHLRLVGLGTRDGGDPRAGA